MSPWWFLVAVGAILLLRALWLLMSVIVDRGTNVETASELVEPEPGQTISKVFTVGIGACRFLVGVGSIAWGVFSYPVGTVSPIDKAWPVAIVVTGAFMLVHLALDEAWAVIVKRIGKHQQDSTNAELGPTAGLRAALPVLVGTPGTVLGLVQVFGAQHPPDAVRFGSLSLVAGIGFGLILWMFVIFDVPDDWRAVTFLSVLLNIAIVFLILGLASIGLAVFWRA
jgi:hypothetical protein